jgi:hypothetical protein
MTVAPWKSSITFASRRISSYRVLHHDQTRGGSELTLVLDAFADISCPAPIGHVFFHYFQKSHFCS